MSFALLAVPAAFARVNVVSLPGRDTVQLTIYNSADLTLVKETRVLTFRKGLNRLEFSWANTLIDPTSVEFRALTHADQADVLDVRFPPRVANTLEWRIQSEFAGEVQVEIRYFTSGITWSADNVKESLSEYFLYTVEGRDTIPSGWSKRLPSFKTPDVPITSYYKFERERWGDQVMRYYRFTNSEPSKLGKEPLPDGEVNAFRVVTDDNLYSFVGRTAVKYIPVNEFVELELGNDREVLVKPTLLNWEKTKIQFDNNGDVKGWTIKEAWQGEVQNSKDIDAVLDIRRNFSGDWSLRTEARYEKVDANKVKFALPLKAREKQQFTYELTTNHGSNVTR